MKYLTLLRANIKSQRGSFIGILTLIFIITISLLAVLTIWKNSNDYEAEQLERIRYGDITCWLTEDPHTEELIRQITALEDTGKVEEQKTICLTSYHVGSYEMNGREEVFAYTFGDGRYDYHIYNNSLTGIEEEPEGLLEGEVYVTPAFCSLYDARVGDRFTIEITGEQDTVSYIIKGFFEDPVSGTSMMGMKTVLMNEADVQNLSGRIQAAEEKALAVRASLLHIFKATDSSLSLGEFQSLLIDRTDLGTFMQFSFPKSAIMGFMLILQNIFAGFLMVFVVVLLVITMVVMGHGISSSIEQDYVNMGILKAVGFRGTDLKVIQSLQYLLAILAGMIPGGFLSGAVVKLINRLTVTATGLMIPSSLAVGISAAALGVILLLLMGFICVKTVGISKITPIRAIRGGAADVYFKSRFTTKIHKKGLSAHLALRQVIAGKKQYVGVCMVAALLVFFISLVGRIGSWLGPDGKGLMDSFSAAAYDIGFRCEDEELQKEVNEAIYAKAAIADRYEFTRESAALNNMIYLMNIVSAPEYYNVIKGRTCRYENEAVVTDTVARELRIGIGDTVLISYMGEEREFIISGIYQCANEMGENFGISREGWEQFGSDSVVFYQYYLLEDSSKAEEIVQLLNERYKDRIILDEAAWSGLDAIMTAMSALEVFMYVVTVIFILVAVYLTGSKVLYKEQHDMGIYKSLGFTAGNIRMAFSLRFGMVAAAGSVLGNVLSGLLTDQAAAGMLRTCGISRFKSSLSLFQMIFYATIVSGLFLVFSYLAAGKIRKVEPGILIVE